MNTPMLGFQSIFILFLHHFVFAKLANCRIRFNDVAENEYDVVCARCPR